MVQSAESTSAQTADPSVQRGVMGMTFAEPSDCPSQTLLGAVCGGVGFACRFDNWSCVTLARRDLDGKDAESLLADGASALRDRSYTVFDAFETGPAGTARDASGCVNQRASREAVWTGYVRSDLFAFDGCALESIIRAGDGNWDTVFRFSTRYGCIDTSTSLFHTPERYLNAPTSANTQTDREICVRTGFISRNAMRMLPLVAEE